MKYRKKPIVIDTIQWDGFNISEIKEFVGKSATYVIHDEFYNRGEGIPSVPPWVDITIHTLEGDHKCSELDYIIKGVNGEFYPCKPDIFAKTYEPVDNAHA